MAALRYRKQGTVLTCEAASTLALSPSQLGSTFGLRGSKTSAFGDEVEPALRCLRYIS